MRAGITLAQWFKRETRRVYAMFGEPAEERDQRRLVEWIDRKGGTVTAREVQMGCRWLREPGAAEAALEGLVQAGRGTWRDVPTTAKGGRPARVFVLSALSTVNETPTKPEESEGFVDVDAVDTVDAPAPDPADAAAKPTTPPNGQPDAGDYVNDLLYEAAEDTEWEVWNDERS
jgi:hypothetical protein